MRSCAGSRRASAAVRPPGRADGGPGRLGLGRPAGCGRPTAPDAGTSTVGGAQCVLAEDQARRPPTARDSLALAQMLARVGNSRGPSIAAKAMADPAVAVRRRPGMTAMRLRLCCANVRGTFRLAR